MVVFEIVESEQDPTYQALAIENGTRQYDFLKSTVEAALSLKRPILSHEIIKALNYHAIACLHVSAGEYRPCIVHVGNHNPVEPWQVQSRMNLFVDEINNAWHVTDPVVLAAYVLWKLNYIHPFVNGNGRTARAAAYFVLCVKNNGWLAGQPILPELLKIHRPAYVQALQAVDASLLPGSQFDLSPLLQLVAQLLAQQTAAAAAAPVPVPQAGTPPPGAPGQNP